MTELEKLVKERTGGSRNTASSDRYLPSAADEEKKAWTPYADAAKSGVGAQNLYAAVAQTMQNRAAQQTPYADAAARMQGGNAAKGTSAIFNSVYGKADDRASSLGSGKYGNILRASDFAELSKSGESKRTIFGDARYDYINNIGGFRAQSDVQQAQGRGQDYAKYAFMTDDEVGVYNYLYATQGKKAANAFLSDLEPELDKQWYTGTNRATTEALGKNAATRTLASAMTVAAQPTRTVTSMIAMADDAVRMAKGQEINPYSKWRQASNITQDLRSDTSQHIEEMNPGLGGKVGSFVYNTAMSAADSAMNSLVAKGFGEAVGLTGDTLMKATNILGSVLMSSEVASLSIAESKEKGYSNAGALALGLTRGAIEYASEAVGGEWVIRKIKANPLSFVTSMALTMIPEGMEEVMSDAANGVINLAIDAAFGTEESGIPKMLEYYRTSGTEWQKKHAELATVLAILGQEGLSFLGGALATIGSSGVQYGTNRANINQVAERLDTTPQNVVQMMQDAQTEDPGVIYALAELTDAENAEDLRQKIGTAEDMKRAAEYLTQQMKAGNDSNEQTDVYTAGAENAPVSAQRAQNEVTIPQSAVPTAPFAQGSRNMEGEFGNGQSTYQGREDGAFDIRTGGQAAAEGRAQALAGGRAEVPGGVGANAQADLRQVTPAQLGIRNGGTEAVTVVDAQKLGGDAARAYNLLTANNIEPVAVRGAIQVNNGYANAYVENGKVYFRVDAVDSSGNAVSPEALVRHELFHNYISEEVLQASDEVIRESMTAEEYDAMYESYRDAYASIYDFEHMSEAEIERMLTEEIAADAYAGLNWFSGDAPVQEAVRTETERNAPAQRAEAQQETTGPPEGRASIVTLPDGKKYVQADRQVIFGNDPSSWADQIEGYINRKIRNGEDVILTTDSGDVLKITKDTAGKASFRNYVRDANGRLRPLTDIEYETKLNAEAHIDELAKVSEKTSDRAKPDEIGRTGTPIHGDLAKNGWYYRRAWFSDFDGKYYQVTISTADGSNGVVVYNVGQIERRSPPSFNGSSNSVAETGARRGKSSSTATIRQTEGNSQEKSSGRASLGLFRNRTLTNEQIEEQTRYDPEKAWAADNIREEYGPDADKEARKAISQRFEQIDAARTAAEETDQRTRPRNSHEEAKVTLTNQQIEKAIRSDSEKAAAAAQIRQDYMFSGASNLETRDAISWKFEQIDADRAAGRTSQTNTAESTAVQSVQEEQREAARPVSNNENRSSDNENLTSGNESRTSETRRSGTETNVDLSGINNRTAAELQREYERRMKEYQKATQRDDPNFPYIAEMKWIQAAERRLAELGDGKRKRRTVGNTKRDIMRLFFTDTANRADVEQMLNRNIGEMMAQGEIREDALDTIVDEMLQAGSVVSNSENSPWIDETHEEIRSDLRGTKLYVSEQTWRDFRKDEARTLREQAREAGITLSKNPNDTAADVRNMELAEKYGEELFPTDISASDMLRNIVDRAAQGVSEKQTLADRLWDEARLEGAGRDQQEAYDRMVGALRDQTEVILREFAEDNHLTLREQTKQGSAASETETKSEAEQRRERLQALAEQDRREAERLRARRNLGEGQPFVPSKGAGAVYQELMSKGQSDVEVQMTGFLKGTPRASKFKIRLEPSPGGVYYTATVMRRKKRRGTTRSSPT